MYTETQTDNASSQDLGFFSRTAIGSFSGRLGLGCAFSDLGCFRRVVFCSAGWYSHSSDLPLRPNVTSQCAVLFQSPCNSCAIMWAVGCESGVLPCKFKLALSPNKQQDTSHSTPDFKRETDRNYRGSERYREMQPRLETPCLCASL